MKRFHERRNNLNVQQCTNSTYNRFTVIQIPTVIALTFFLRFFFCLVDSMETFYLEQSNAFEISRLSAMNFKFKKKNQIASDLGQSLMTERYPIYNCVVLKNFSGTSLRE